VRFRTGGCDDDGRVRKEGRIVCHADFRHWRDFLGSACAVDRGRIGLESE